MPGKYYVTINRKFAYVKVYKIIKKAGETNDISKKISGALQNWIDKKFSKKGIAVHEDHVIFAIRWFKTNITKNANNNGLVVCKECYPKYSKERRRYTSRLSLYIGIGVIFAILLIISTPSLGSALAAIGFLFMFLLSTLTRVISLPSNVME